MKLSRNYTLDTLEYSRSEIDKAKPVGVEGSPRSPVWRNIAKGSFPMGGWLMNLELEPFEDVYLRLL